LKYDTSRLVTAQNGLLVPRVKLTLKHVLTKGKERKSY
jgi:hypothetical protein